MDKARILVLCTHNSARSQMAEGFFRAYTGDHFDVYSAGLEPSEVHPLAKQVMAEVGIDISSQRSKSLLEYMGKMHFGYLITVCSRAEKECPVFPDVSVRLHWPFDDPAVPASSQEESLAKFRRVRDEISTRIKGWLAEQGIPVSAG